VPAAENARRRAEPPVARAIPVAPASKSPVARPAAPVSRTSDQIAPSDADPPPREEENARSQAVPAAASAVNTMSALNDRRPIALGDRLSITIIEDEQPPRAMLVTDAGEIDAPWIGRVAVNNRTCKQLAYYLKNLFEKDLYFQATVLVSLDAASGRAVSRGRFYLAGQIARPGPYEIPSDEALTVSKAIMRAGGFTQYANKKKVVLMRNNPAKSEMDQYFLNMTEVMEKGKRAGDMEIQPEDTITVNEKFFNIGF
jgi:protein involved in polysaccharide export with SLBB domain